MYTVADRVLSCRFARVSPRPVAPRNGPFHGADLRGPIARVIRYPSIVMQH